LHVDLISNDVQQGQNAIIGQNPKYNIYRPINNIIIPIKYFNILLNLPYFSLCAIFFAVPTDVPRITTKILFPIEYKSSKNIQIVLS